MDNLIIFILGILFGRLIIEIIDFISELFIVWIQDIKNTQALKVSRINKEISNMEDTEYSNTNVIGFKTNDDGLEEEYIEE